MRPTSPPLALAFVLACTFGGPQPARAQPAAEDVPSEAPSTEAEALPSAEVEEPERTRVAVLILTTGALDPAMADGLTELLIGAVAARGGVIIVGKEEFQARLGQGDDGTLECVSSMACMGRVGVELDVVEVIAGTLAQRDERWVFNLNRVDVRTGEMVGRVFREVEGDLGAVADALSAAIPELYASPEPGARTVAEDAGDDGAPSPAGTLLLSTDVPEAEVLVDGALVGVTRRGALQHRLAAGSAVVEVHAPGHRPWTRSVRVAPGEELALAVNLVPQWTQSVQPWVWIGGGATLALLAAAIPLGVASQATFELTAAQRRSGEVTRDAALAFYDARHGEAIAADVLFAVAGALAISAVIALFFPERRRASGGGAASSRLDTDAPWLLRRTF